MTYLQSNGKATDLSIENKVLEHIYSKLLHTI